MKATPTHAFSVLHVVDTETGKVDVLSFTAVQDAGRAIHPSYVEGQMQGGAVPGIGWVLNEECIHDDDGVMENAGFLDYRGGAEPVPPVRRARRGGDSDHGPAGGGVECGSGPVGLLD